MNDRLGVRSPTFRRINPSDSWDGLLPGDVFIAPNQIFWRIQDDPNSLETRGVRTARKPMICLSVDLRGNGYKVFYVFSTTMGVLVCER